MARLRGDRDAMCPPPLPPLSDRDAIKKTYPGRGGRTPLRSQSKGEVKAGKKKKKKKKWDVTQTTRGQCSMEDGGGRQSELRRKKKQHSVSVWIPYSPFRTACYTSTTS